MGAQDAVIKAILEGDQSDELLSELKCLNHPHKELAILRASDYFVTAFVASLIVRTRAALLIAGPHELAVKRLSWQACRLPALRRGCVQWAWAGLGKVWTLDLWSCTRELEGSRPLLFPHSLFPHQGHAPYLEDGGKQERVTY